MSNYHLVRFLLENVGIVEEIPTQPLCFLYLLFGMFEYISTVLKYGAPDKPVPLSASALVLSDSSSKNAFRLGFCFHFIQLQVLAAEQYVYLHLFTVACLLQTELPGFEIDTLQYECYSQSTLHMEQM